MLYIAMAGSHQLWQINLGNNQVSLFAGSGYENIQDGSAEQAALAQPSGITSHGKTIYFADSEVSAVREASISENGEVKTIIGHGLFKFGDVDGNYRKARFQHPLGIVYVDSMLYVADTYNNKIKQVDPEKRYSKGKHDMIINAANLETGVYFYTVRSGENAVTKKMVIE